MKIYDTAKKAAQLALKLKKAKKDKKTKSVMVPLEDLNDLINATMVLSRINKLAESYAEALDPEDQVGSIEQGKAEAWSIVITELDQLET